MTPALAGQGKGELELKIRDEVTGEADLTDDLLQFIETIPETSGQKFLNDMKKKCG